MKIKKEEKKKDKMSKNNFLNLFKFIMEINIIKNKLNF